MEIWVPVTVLPLTICMTLTKLIASLKSSNHLPTRIHICTYVRKFAKCTLRLKSTPGLKLFLIKRQQEESEDCELTV